MAAAASAASAGLPDDLAVELRAWCRPPVSAPRAARATAGVGCRFGLGEGDPDHVAFDVLARANGVLSTSASSPRSLPRNVSTRSGTPI